MILHRSHIFSLESLHIEVRSLFNFLIKMTSYFKQWERESEQTHLCIVYKYLANICSQDQKSHYNISYRDKRDSRRTIYSPHVASLVSLSITTTRSECDSLPCNIYTCTWESLLARTEADIWSNYRDKLSVPDKWHARRRAQQHPQRATIHWRSWLTVGHSQVARFLILYMSPQRTTRVIRWQESILLKCMVIQLSKETYH